MLWLLFALIPAVGDGLSNIIDGHLSNKKFHNPWVLLFYSGIMELLFLPFVLLYRLPAIFSFKVMIFFPIIAFLDFLTLIFYYKALKEDDTSIVASLFSLGKIFVPILAFFVVGERLSLLQYLAFFVIIFSSTLLTASSSGGKIMFNKSLLLMFLSSLVHSIEGVIYKYVLESVDWVSGFVYVTLFSILGFIIIAIIKNKEVREQFGKFKANFKLVIFNSSLAFVSTLSTVIAFSMAQITLVKAVFATQPFFVILFTYLIQKFSKAECKEKMDKGNLLKKLILFTIMLLALIFVIN
ncbi:MAG: EamA family transporter [Candidatus Magasanikiibacteriota bacterium]